MTDEVERLEYLQEDGSPHFLTKSGSTWVSDRCAVKFSDIMRNGQIARRCEELEARPHVDSLDASRYRWLRDNGHIAFLRKGGEVDALVDAAMAKPTINLEI